MDSKFNHNHICPYMRKENYKEEEVVWREGWIHRRETGEGEFSTHRIAKSLWIVKSQRKNSVTEFLDGGICGHCSLRPFPGNVWENTVLWKYYWDRFSIYSSGWPGSHFVDQVILAITYPPISAPRVLGLKACVSMPTMETFLSLKN